MHLYYCLKNAFSCLFSGLLNHLSTTLCKYGSRRVYGKRNDCPDFGNWIENVLEPLLQRYKTWDIYNADETSLFFKSLSDRTMSFDGEQPTGSKLTSSKDHLSLMLCANMIGTDK